MTTALPHTPPRVRVDSPVGPLDLIVWSPTSIVVFGDDAREVNRVPVTFRVDVGPETNPHSPNVGNLTDRHVYASRADGQWSKDVSYATKSKIGAAALAAVQEYLADPEVAFQAKTDDLRRAKARADRKVDEAYAAVSEAQAEARAADEAFCAHLASKA